MLQSGTPCAGVRVYETTTSTYSVPPDCRPGSYNFFTLSHVGWVFHSGLFEVGLILLCTEHTVTCFLSHQRMPVLVTQLLSVFILQPKKPVFGGNDIIIMSPHIFT